jgi:hypothetical protein
VFWRRGRLFLKRFDLQTDRLDIRIDALIQERALYDIELLAVPAIAPALQRRHLVHQLIDLQLLVYEFFGAAGKLRGPCAGFSIALGQLCFAVGEWRVRAIDPSVSAASVQIQISKNGEESMGAMGLLHCEQTRR